MSARAPRAASWWRRLGAMSYDAIVLAGLWFGATGVVVAAQGGAAVVPRNAPFTVYLLVVAYGYFAWSWTAGGQTIGMRAWRVRLVDGDGRRAIRRRQAAIRFCAAIVSWGLAGAGFTAALFDVDGLTWHDRWSRTRLVDA